MKNGFDQDKEIQKSEWIAPEITVLASDETDGKVPFFIETTTSSGPS